MHGQDYVDPNPEYWQDYNNLQSIKHALIREYLNGWFPKLGFWAGRIVYIDTHAGRGRHETGDMGSPLVALTTFLSHRSRDSIPDHSDMHFIFIEHDPQNAAALQNELTAVEEQLQALERRRLKVHTEVHPGDCQQVLGEALEYLRTGRRRVAPSFIFVDPYGFKVSCALLRDLMAFERVELFVNVMWRHLYMGICNAQKYSGWNRTLAWILDDPDWNLHISCDGLDEAADQAISFLQRKLGAKWATTVRMLGSNNATEYILAHFTNHDDGRDLMKEVRWKVCPAYSGVFAASKAQRSDQLTLLGPEPDWSQLRRWVQGALEARPRRWEELLDSARPTDWLSQHVSKTVRDLRREGTIHATGFTGRFSQKANPLLSIAP